MPGARSEEMLYRAARLYYLEGYSQAQVSAAVGVSRSNVSRVLAEARRRGIVTITVEDPAGRARDLEDELVKRFGVREARVRAAGDASAGEADEEPIARTGRLAAERLLHHLPDSGAVALSWGGSVRAVVDAVPAERPRPELEVLPLVGGMSDADGSVEGNRLVARLAERLGAAHRPLYAPAVLASASTRDALVREPSIARVLADAAAARVAVVGIGRVGLGSSRAIAEAMGLKPAQECALEERAVGDCCTRFFDAAGRPVPSPAERRVIAVELAALREVPTVIGVAAGAEKGAAVRGALAARLVDVLVVDEALARAVLADE